MRTLAFIIAPIGAILLFLQAFASSNTSAVFSQYYWQLFILNILLAATLFVILIIQLYKLRQKVKFRVFGSRLTMRLTMMFALVAILPGLLIYIISVQFLNRSIDTWFDVRVGSALERGLNLGQSAIDYSLQDLERRGRLIAQKINSHSSNEISIFTELAYLREQFHIPEMALFALDGKLLANLSNSATHLASPPSNTQLKQAEYQLFSMIETGQNQKLIMRCLVPIHVSSLRGTEQILQLIAPVTEKLAADAEVVNQARNDYKQLLMSRNGLKWIHNLTLTLAFLLLMLGVFVLAIYLSDKLSAPLSLLAAGTKAIAQGDYSQQQPVVSHDELGILTHSFNRMTRQLAEARLSLERNRQEQATARAYLETILSNMTAGVLSFDSKWNLRSYNDSAVRILHPKLTSLKSTTLTQWENIIPELAPLCSTIQQGLSEMKEPHWQRQIELRQSQDTRCLLVHCSHIQTAHIEEHNSGYVVVLEDITRLIAAQRDAAWGEVARRLAHEIKNPLTPIQLAAERLEHKLSRKLTEGDAAFLVRSTHTIVNQVSALKNMVDAFKDYARQPSTKMQPVDFQQILSEVLVLYENMPIVMDTKINEPMIILGEATLLRQVIHNLLQNAQDAIVHIKQPLVTIKTNQDRLFVTLMVTDNGNGFPDSILPRVFEPYATSKSKGTGLGLAMIKKIVEEHQGRIQVGNQAQGGAFIRIDLPRWEDNT